MNLGVVVSNAFIRQNGGGSVATYHTGEQKGSNNLYDKYYDELYFHPSGCVMCHNNGI